MAKSKPGGIHIKIVEVMRRFPDGITAGQIRSELEKEGLRAEEQSQLDRRRRDLTKWFEIEKVRQGQLTRYRLIGVKRVVDDEGPVGVRLRAAVIHAAHGRCQMCGRTIPRDGIVLVVDHMKPRDWGGGNDRGNLWAICEECNAGKKAYFSSLRVDAALMEQVTSHESVHVRIGELLKTFGVGKPAPSWLLEIVADQDDWQKRLRELRYPVIGWEIDFKRAKSASGKHTTDYILRRFQPWPIDPSGMIRAFEAERQRGNRKPGSSGNCDEP